MNRGLRATRNRGKVNAAARCIADPRNPLLITHDVRDMLRQRVYGLALGGAEGVRQVLEGFRAELDLTMALSGVTSIGEITAETLVRADPRPA